MNPSRLTPIQTKQIREKVGVLGNKQSSKAAKNEAIKSLEKNLESITGELVELINAGEQDKALNDLSFALRTLLIQDSNLLSDQDKQFEKINQQLENVEANLRTRLGLVEDLGGDKTDSELSDSEDYTALLKPHAKSLEERLLELNDTDPTYDKLEDLLATVQTLIDNPDIQKEYQLDNILNEIHTILDQSSNIPDYTNAKDIQGADNFENFLKQSAEKLQNSYGLGVRIGNVTPENFTLESDGSWSVGTKDNASVGFDDEAVQKVQEEIKNYGEMILDLMGKVGDDGNPVMGEKFKLLSEIAEVNLAFNKIIDIDKGELDQVSEQDGVLDDFLEDLETVKKWIKIT